MQSIIGRSLLPYLQLTQQPSAAIPPGAGPGKVNVFIDSADHMLKMKDHLGHVTVIEGSPGGGGSGIDDVEEPLNKDMPCLATSQDGDLACLTGLLHDPRPDSAITIALNGVTVGNLKFGGKTGAAAYFSNDSGVSACTRQNLTIGSRLYWQGSIAGLELDTSDTISIFYTYVV